MKLVAWYWPMPAVLVLVSGPVTLTIQTARTPSLLRSTATLPSVMMVSSTHAFVASPEIVTAYAIAGRLSFNPLKDKLINENGEGSDAG
jgi:hypothetical protein